MRYLLLALIALALFAVTVHAAPAETLPPGVAKEVVPTFEYLHDRIWKLEHPEQIAAHTFPACPTCRGRTCPTPAVHECNKDCQCAKGGKCTCSDNDNGKCNCPNCGCKKSVCPKCPANQGECGDSCESGERTGMFGGNGPIRRFFRKAGKVITAPARAIRGRRCGCE